MNYFNTEYWGISPVVVIGGLVLINMIVSIYSSIKEWMNEE